MISITHGRVQTGTSAEERRDSIRISARNIAVGEATIEEWPQLLKQFPQHSVFHRLPWMQTIEDVHGATLRLLRADIDDECVALWPVFFTRKGPLRIIGSPLGGWSTPYMGPLLQPHVDAKSVIAEMLRSPLLKRYSYFACKTLNYDQAPIDLEPYGFESVLKFETYALDLTIGLESLWDNLKSECRSRIRKAEKLGLEVRLEQDDSFLEDYWAMSVETFALTHIQPMFTRPFITEVWRRMHAAGDVCTLSAFQNGERIAALVLPYDGNSMFYWTGASWVRCRSIPAHNLLHWKAIEHAVQLGLKRYDFISTLGGAGRFKRTFGPQTVWASTQYERTSSRLIKLLKNKYEQYLQFKTAHGGIEGWRAALWRLRFASQTNNSQAGDD